jgi:hypothetical protein
VWFRWGLAIFLPTIAVACASMREYGLTVELENPDAYRPESIVISVAMALAMGAILWLLLARPSLRGKPVPPLAAFADAATG